MQFLAHLVEKETACVDVRASQALLSSNPTSHLALSRSYRSHRLTNCNFLLRNSLKQLLIHHNLLYISCKLTSFFPLMFHMQAYSSCVLTSCLLNYYIVLIVILL